MTTKVVFSYQTRDTPDDYVCEGCQAQGVKLWFLYGTHDIKKQRFLCATCAAQDQARDISSMDENGVYDGQHGPTNTIGWFVPAIPLEENIGYWPQGSRPEEGLRWWEGLPLGK